MKLENWSDLQLTDFIVEEGLMTEEQFNNLNPNRQQMIELIRTCLKNIK